MAALWRGVMPEQLRKSRNPAADAQPAGGRIAYDHKN
jgi:hypothetical protein